MTDDEKNEEIRRLLADELGVDPDDLIGINPSAPKQALVEKITEMANLPATLNPQYNDVHTAASAAAAELAEVLWDQHLEMREKDPSIPENADVTDDAVRAFIMDNPEETLLEWGIPAELWTVVTAFTALHQRLIDAVIQTHTEALRDSLHAKNLSNSAETDFDAAISDFLGGQS